MSLRARIGDKDMGGGGGLGSHRSESAILSSDRRSPHGEEHAMESRKRTVSGEYAPAYAWNYY